MKTKKKRELLPSYITTSCKCGYQFDSLWKYRFDGYSYIKCPKCGTLHKLDIYQRYYVYEVKQPMTSFAKIAEVVES